MAFTTPCSLKPHPRSMVIRTLTLHHDGRGLGGRELTQHPRLITGTVLGLQAWGTRCPGRRLSASAAH